MFQQQSQNSQGDMKNDASSASQTATEPTAESLKELGNACVRGEKFAEALIHYSAAIKLSPKDHALYSNRSLAFLREKQFYYANLDAETAIQLNPSWPKGHFRKAEVMLAVGHYDLALLYYGRAIQLQPGDRTLLLAAQKAAKLSKQQEEYEHRLPWVGAGIGIIVGVIIALSDRLLTKNPTLKHPALMVFLVIIIACLGYIISRCIRYYVRLQKKSLLEPPVDLLEEFKQEPDDEADGDGEPHIPASRTRYTKAQARMRFRKGKS